MKTYKRHGYHGITEYNIWKNMKQRCLNPKNDSYYRYGGRGIKVYEPWLTDFKAFYDYMGPRPGPDYSIDRIDNDGHYEPGNVRWATNEQQANNRSSNIDVVLPNGEIVNTAEASKQLQLSSEVIRRRINRGGKIDAPFKEPRMGIEYQGEFKTWKELSTLYNVPPDRICARIYSGMDIDKAVSMPKQKALLYPYKGQYLNLREIAQIEKIDHQLLKTIIQNNVDLKQALGEAITLIKKQKYDTNGNRLDITINHGMHGSPEHRAWYKLIHRCHNSKSEHFRNWGAIGAVVCDRWRYSFQNFYKDMGPRPKENYKLKVINRIKLIGPGNAEWAPR